MLIHELLNESLKYPKVLYHATYKPLLASIKKNGLGGKGSERKKWEDSVHGVVYLAVNADIAESYAESSDFVPEDWLDEIVILKIDATKLNPDLLKIDANVKDNDGDTLEYHGIISPDLLSY